MTKKYTKNKKTIGLLLTAILAIFLFLFIRNLPNSNEQKVNSDANYKEVASEFMNFSVNVPQNVETEEGYSFVTILFQEGDVKIDRNGTNFDSVEEYVQDFDTKRSLNVISESPVLIGKYSGITRIEKLNGGPVLEEKVYYIYVDNYIYSIHTSSPDLYDELDTIAHSFHYTGE